MNEKTVVGKDALDKYRRLDNTFLGDSMKWCVSLILSVVVAAAAVVVVIAVASVCLLPLLALPFFSRFVWKHAHCCN